MNVENFEPVEKEETTAPAESSSDMEELSDEDLEEVAGGWDGDGGG